MNVQFESGVVSIGRRIENKRDRRENAMATDGRHRGEGKTFHVVYNTE